MKCVSYFLLLQSVLRAGNANFRFRRYTGKRFLVVYGLHPDQNLCTGALKGLLVGRKYYKVLGSERPLHIPSSVRVVRYNCYLVEHLSLLRALVEAGLFCYG